MQIKGLNLPSKLIQQTTVTIPDQQITVVIGQNGVGKSTLLNALARRVPEAAYLPQKNQVYDEISVQALLALGQQRAQLASTEEAIWSALDITPLLHCSMTQLSGGQQQRVWLAFVLLQQAPLVLLDEPLTALDLRYQKRLAELLVALNVSAVMVVHDLNYAQKIADWVWLLHNHNLVAGTPEVILQADLLSDAYQTLVQQRITQDGISYFEV